jgi:flagellar hook-associated protein 1 FlgK
VVSSGAYTSGGTISFDGIDVVISNDAGGPQAGDRLVISPIDSAIQNAGVAVPAALSIAASSSLAGLPGDNQDALSITDLNRRGMAFLNGQNFSDFYSSLVANAGSLSQTAQDSYSFEQSVMNNLQAKRESVSGVSLDEEAVNLMKYQRSFQAGAKLISITDELLQTILQL